MYVELHAHSAFSFLDGASLPDELAAAAAEYGYSAMALTDHNGVSGSMEFAQAAAPLGLRAIHGAEVDLSLLWAIPSVELRRLTIAQTGRYLLLEFPYRGWPLALNSSVSALVGQGVTPLLAHPERNPEVQDRPERLGELVAAGALVQVTAASLDGRLDRSAQSTAKRLLELGLVHVLASDAHGPHIREAGLTAAARRVGDEGLARYLTIEVPGAIVAGEPVPEYPQVRLGA